MTLVIAPELKWEEATHRAFFLPFYVEQGWAVEEDRVGVAGSSEWDVILNYDGRPVRVDEKAGRRVTPNMAFEVVQCVRQRSWGWALNAEVDELVYGMWDGRDADPARPVVVYRVHVRRMQNWFVKHAADTRLKWVPSGYGLTILALVPWRDLINADAAEVLLLDRRSE